MKIKKMIMLLCFLLIQGYSYLNAQVTIGSLTTPDKGSLLQLREKIADPNLTGANVVNLENASKGLLFPRVALRAFDLLDPLYGTATENPDKTWTDAATDEDKFRATGMVVFNVNPNAAGLDIGLYVWNQNEWIKLSGESTAAEITPIRCDDITIHGNYVQGETVDDTHFITLTIANVARPGHYSINASSGNGYNFYADGVVLDKGSTTIKLSCQGTPRVGGQSDNITLTGIETDKTCIATIPVSAGTFAVSGTVTDVTGNYKKQTPLSSANTIKLNINISSTTDNCSISAQPRQGIEFKPWTGTLSAGTNTIILEAVTGAQPTTTTDLSLAFNIKAGGQVIGVVNAIIPVTLPKLTYALVGTDGTFSWNNSQRKKALTSGKAFGPNGVVKIDEFGLLKDWSFSSVSSSNGAGKKLKAELDKYDANPSTATLPDIILFFAYNVDGSDSEHEVFSHLLSRYINAGGCVIYGAADAATKPVNTLLKGIFPEITTDVAVTQIAGTVWDDNVYLINNLPKDPIVNGPFGNLSNLYWGEDNSSSNQIVVKSKSNDGIQICSAYNTNGKKSQNSDYSMVWYSPGKNFFYFGDTCGAADNNSGRDYPSYYDSATGLPKSKKYGPSPQQTTYNAALELNAVAWAIRAAVDHGINYK